MSAVALWGNALAFACLRACAFPLSVADTGGASPATTAKRCVDVLTEGEDNSPTGLCAAGYASWIAGLSNVLGYAEHVDMPFHGNRGTSPPTGLR